MGVTRNWRAHPEARSVDRRLPPALSAATSAPNEHMETMQVDPPRHGAVDDLSGRWFAQEEHVEDHRESNRDGRGTSSCGAAGPPRIGRTPGARVTDHGLRRWFVSSPGERHEGVLEACPRHLEVAEGDPLAHESLDGGVGVE